MASSDVTADPREPRERPAERPAEPEYEGDAEGEEPRSLQKTSTSYNKNAHWMSPHAFWSERAQTETQLRKMKPATLPPLEDSSIAGYAEVTAPVGNPASYGPVKGQAPECSRTVCLR